MKTKYIFFFILILLSSCAEKYQIKKTFQFIENENRIELWEHNSLVFGYQKTPKYLSSKFARNNYIHPLVSLVGDTLTEDWPSDHAHHRGIFWAWHQIYIDTLNVSDSWGLNNFISDISSLKTKTTNNIAELNIQLFWKSPLYKNGKPYIKEETKISVSPSNKNFRKIDFNISLIALVSGVRIGGADNEKGYGGFSIRLKMPDGLVFTSNNGEVTPKRLQIKAGPWMDFSAPFSKDKKNSGVTLITHQDNSNNLHPWILRQKKSMQNIVFPGKNTIPLFINDTLNLKYTLLIHNDYFSKEVESEIKSILEK